MEYADTQYVGRSEQLLAAAQQFRAALDNPGGDPDLAVDDLLAASGGNLGQAMILGYMAQPGVTRRANQPEDALSAALLNLQSANLLMSAGVALREGNSTGETLPFDDAVAHVQTTLAEASTNAQGYRQGFAPEQTIRSSDVDAARQTFRSSADIVLKELVDGGLEVSSAVLHGLAKLDSGQVRVAFSKLGESVEIVATLGRLVRKGVEKLKAALDLMTSLFGSEAIHKAKAELGDIWKKFTSGDYSRAILEQVFRVTTVKADVARLSRLPGLQLDRIDGASNALAPLSQEYARRVKLLNGVATGVGIAALTAGYFTALLPWLPLAIGGAYLGVLAGALLLGMEYTGAVRVLKWVSGVEQVAQQIQPA